MTILALAAVLVLTACGPTEAGGRGDRQQQEVAIPVEVDTVRTGPIEAWLRATSTLEAAQEAQIVARVAGIVEQVAVEEGEQVRAGQVLVRMERERLELELRRARAALEQARSEYERNRELARRKLVSPDVLDRARFDLDAARAAYELAELSLRESEVTAPFDGVVTARYVKVGNHVNAMAPLLRITGIHRVEAPVHLPETEVGKLAVGQLAELEIDALGEARLPGRVARIVPVVDPATGTVKVTTTVEDEAGRLRPGMFARVGIRYDRREQALLVPRAALIDQDGEQTVFVVGEDSIAQRRRLRTGYAEGDVVEVLDGLTDGERVVVTGQSQLRDGARVTIVEPLGETAS